MRPIFFLIVFFLISQTVSADQNSVHQAIDFLKTACAAGEKVEIKVEGDGGLSLIKKGVQGRIYFSETDARGIAEGLSGELQHKNLDSVRDCMRPYISRILDAILGQSERSPSASSRPSSSIPGRDITKPVFESSILSIEVVSLQEQGPYFNLKLKHISKARQPIEVIAFRHSEDTFLLDDRDNQYPYMTTYAAGKGDDLTITDRGRGIELVPDVPRIISFQFARSNESYGKVFNFSTRYGYRFSQFHTQFNSIYINIKSIGLDK